MFRVLCELSFYKNMITFANCQIMFSETLLNVIEQNNQNVCPRIKPYIFSMDWKLLLVSFSDL